MGANTDPSEGKSMQQCAWEEPGWRGTGSPWTTVRVFEGGWKISPREMPADCNTLPGRGEALGTPQRPSRSHRVPSLFPRTSAGRGVGTGCHIYLFIWLHSTLALARGIIVTACGVFVLAC